MRNYTIIFILFLLPWSELMAQELSFSQFFNTKQYFNPVDVASFEGHDAYLIYRSQWQGLQDPFTEMQFSTSHAILRDGDPEQHIAGYGIEYHTFNTGQNNLNNSGLSASLGYNLYLSSEKTNKLKFGLKLGYLMKSINNSNLTWGNQFVAGQGYDPNQSTETTFTESAGAFTVGAGIGYYHNHKSDHDESPMSYHLKFAVLNINEPTYTLTGAKDVTEMFITSEFGFHYLFHEKVLLGTDILYMKQSNNELINPALNLSYIINDSPENNVTPTWIKIGTSYRLDNAIVGLVGFGNGIYRIHFSYDAAANGLNETNIGFNAYEISLGIKLIKKKHVEANPYNNRHNPRI